MTKIITKKIVGTNRHWKNFLDKEYLGAHNLEEGEEMLLTIAKVVGNEAVTTADGTKTKIVLYFKENVQKMILNITNGNILTTLYGSHPDGWIGKKIQVYPASVKAFGKVQDALRIRDSRPKEDVNLDEFRTKLEVAKTLEELGEIWKSLPLTIKTDKGVEAIKNELKAKLK